MPISLHDVLSDITLKTLPRLAKMQKRHFASQPEICTELPLNITRYMRDLDQAADPPGLRAGKLYQYVLEHKEARIAEGNLLAGTTSTKDIGVMLYPDLYALVLWPELETMATRKQNPFKISPEDIDILNFEVFPFWLDRTVMEVTRRAHDNPPCERLMERIIFYLASKGVAISHTIPNYGVMMKKDGVVVEKGLAALIADAREARAASHDPEQQSFYQGVELALGGIINYAEGLSDKALELARQESDPVRRGELLKMRDICNRVPAQPPRTFWEALNAIWICKIALHQENGNFALSLGRLDQILYPLYAQDIKNGILTVAEAVELVGCFWLSIADHVPISPETAEEILGGTGSNQAITLGGVDRDGKDAVNDLTYVMLRVTELLRLRDPNVNARYHYEKNPPKYLERLYEVNKTTKATPCFHNDVAVIETLQETYKGQGISVEDARDYGVVGCVEPTSAGRTYGHPGALFINLTAALEMALFGGRHRLTGLTEDDQIGPKTTPLKGLGTWQKFKDALKTQIKWLIDQAITFNNYAGITHQKIHRTPMLSALMEGCLENGKDVIFGGAKYNSSGATIIGLSEVVDSVTAIQEFVYKNPGETINAAAAESMIDAINANWKGFANLQALVKNSEEKFGRDDPVKSKMAKDNAVWLMGLIHDNFRPRENYRGGRYNAGYWTMTYHAGFGKITGALPSGRNDRESFASGITPVSGSAPELNPCLNFVGGLNHRQITNGQALNLKYYPPTTTLPDFAKTIETYFRMGGLQVQFNIIDRETLNYWKDYLAKHPYEHPHLLVRVSGYTAYFEDLNPQMQQEIIDRAEYDLATGHEVP
jgi:pyruvate formate-lyase/glycerol dehydratase family glycyl radical enzyme